MKPGERCICQIHSRLLSEHVCRQAVPAPEKMLRPVWTHTLEKGSVCSGKCSGRETPEAGLRLNEACGLTGIPA